MTQRNSIVLEKDVILSWLNTPFAYYTGVPFGFNANLFLYKNKEYAQIALGSMLDDMERDLGTWIYDVIESVSLGTDKDTDTFKIEIKYNNSQTTFKDLEK